MTDERMRKFAEAIAEFTVQPLLNQHDAEVKRLKGQLQERDQRIAELEAGLSRDRHDHAELHNAYGRKRAEIASLKARIAKLENGKAFQQQLIVEVDLRYEVEALKIEIASLKAQLEEARADTENQRLRADGSRKLLERSEQQLADAKAEILRWQLCCCDREDNEAKIQARLDEATAEVARLKLQLKAAERDMRTVRELIHPPYDREDLLEAAKMLQMALAPKAALNPEPVSDDPTTAHLMSGGCDHCPTCRPEPAKPGCSTCPHLIGCHHDGPGSEACTVKDCGCLKYVKPANSRMFGPVEGCDHATMYCNLCIPKNPEPTPRYLERGLSTIDSVVARVHSCSRCGGSHFEADCDSLPMRMPRSPHA